MNTEQAKYETLWANHPSYRVVAPGEHLADQFIALARPKPHHRVIDFGCGTGRGALRIQQRTGATVTGIDFAAGCLDPEVAGMIEFRQHDLTQPLNLERPADYGYCTDVMEHIPPEDVDAVLGNVLTSARRVYLCISTVDDVMGALIGEPLHLTVKDPAWWREKLTETHKCRIFEERVFADKDGAPVAVMFWLSAWATFEDFEHRCTLNVDESKFVANIHANLSLGLREVVPHVENDTIVSLLCGGPSLADFVGQIEGPIVTVNGSYNWAIAHGMRPGLQVVLDSREFNRRFVEPVLPDCKYALSSQCDPQLVASLPHDQVLLWHGAGEVIQQALTEYDAAHNQSREYYPIPGGSTVGLRALPLLAMLGFRKINVYGLDSCIRRGAHHAYEQSENDGVGVIPIIIDGREFLCEGWMVKQAEEFQKIVQHILIPAGVELAVHGDGMIAAILSAAAAAKE